MLKHSSNKSTEGEIYEWIQDIKDTKTDLNEGHPFTQIDRKPGSGWTAFP